MTRASRLDYYFADEYDLAAMRLKLYSLRKGFDISQEEMAKKLGVTKSQYNRAESGEAKALSKEVVSRAINYFGLQEDEVIIPKKSAPIVSQAFEDWISNREISEPYLKRAYTQYLKDTGKL